MAIDPNDSALDAIATYFGTAVATLHAARRGWPEHATDLRLDQGPHVTVTFVDDQRTNLPPTCINEDDGAPFLWRVGDLTITAQLDLWASHRAVRDETAQLLEAAFHNGLPIIHGLWLTQADYHERPLTVTASAGRSMDDANGAEVGEWRRRWTLEISTDLVVETSALQVPQQTSTILRVTADGVAEPDITIP